MAAPFFSYLNYKNSDYGQSNGYIENIQVTSDTGNLLSIYWTGPNGFTLGPSSVPLPDLIGLEAGTYTGVVTDTVTLETGTVEITIAELPQVIINAVFDSACIGTVNCDCVLDVLDFTHNSDTFKYDLYKNGVLVDTYYGSTGSEAHQFTGLCDGEYFLVATETDQTIYTFNNPYNCDPGTVEIDDTLNVASIVSNWRRFALSNMVFDFSLGGVNNGATAVKEIGSDGGWSGLRPDGTIDYTDKRAFFYTGGDPASYTDPGGTTPLDPDATRFLGTYTGGGYQEGEHLNDSFFGIVPSEGNNKKYFYDLTLEKFVYVVNVDFNSLDYRWVTFQAKLPIETNPGDPLKWPNATDFYTTSSNWNALPIGSQDYTIDPEDGNTVKLASAITTPVTEKINAANNALLRNGFYSDCKYITYEHEVTIGSTYNDDDFISIILVRAIDDDGVSHFLSLDFRARGEVLADPAPAVSIQYNGVGFEDRDQSIYTFNNGNTDIDLFEASPYIIKNVGVNNPLKNTLTNFNVQGNIRVKITRSGDQGQFFKIEMTDTMGDKGGIQTEATKDLGEANPYNSLYTIEFALDDPATWTAAPGYANGDELLKFLGPNEFGYATFSQPESNFYHLNFIGEQSNTKQDLTSELAASDTFFAGEPCGCPEGFVYNAKTDECDIEIQESIICNPTTYTVEKTSANPQYGAQGAYFYEDASNRPLPLTRSQLIVGGTTQGDRVVMDSGGNVLAVQRIIQNSVWGNQFLYDKSIVTFAPDTGSYSRNVDTGTPVPNTTNLAQVANNSLCSGASCPSNVWTTSPWYGRMNNIGVWTNVSIGNIAQPIDEWIGFTACVEVPTTKKYTIGISGDNWFRFKVDGQLYFDFSLSGTDGYQRWHIVELELTAGQHIIEFEGLNRPSSGNNNPASLAAEIYDASSATLQTITTVEALEPYIIWSTADLIGEPFDSGEESGCHCPDGFTLSACDGELKCVRYESVPYVKCNCYKAIDCDNPELFFYFTIDSSLPPLDTGLIYTFNDPAGRASAEPSQRDRCFYIEESKECDVTNPNLAVKETFVDCDECSGTCYSLTSCTNPENIVYFDGLGAPELAQYVGQVISVYNSNTEITTCATVATIPCRQAVNPLPAIPEFIIIQEEFCDCEECLPKPIEVPVLEINNRTVKPGYNTPGCSTEYVEKISCGYSEALYQEVISRRYGIEFCCSKDLNSLDIKKQLMEFKMITDPDACKEIPSDCCPPCSLELELTAIPTTECQAPEGINLLLAIPPIEPSPDCRLIRVSRRGNDECQELTVTIQAFTCAGEPITIILNADNPEQTECIDIGLPYSVTPSGCLGAGVLGTCS
jgi:hypothetical protein